MQIKASDIVWIILIICITVMAVATLKLGLDSKAVNNCIRSGAHANLQNGRLYECTPKKTP